MIDAGRHAAAVVAELTLPGALDGFGRARELRERQAGVEVVLTSSGARLAGSAADLCAEGPLEKPYHPQELVRRIRALTGRRAARKP